MCFAPQRRALFRHLNLQKWSGNGVFCTFWLGNVLRATTVCNFSSLIWPVGSAAARFSEPTFRPSLATNHWKNKWIATFSYLFAHLHLLSSDSFSSDLLSSTLSLLFASALLCFSSVHIVGSFTSKLPSTINLPGLPDFHWFSISMLVYQGGYTVHTPKLSGIDPQSRALSIDFARPDLRISTELPSFPTPREVGIAPAKWVSDGLKHSLPKNPRVFHNVSTVFRSLYNI